MRDQHNVPIRGLMAEKNFPVDKMEPLFGAREPALRASPLIRSKSPSQSAILHSSGFNLSSKMAVSRQRFIETNSAQPIFDPVKSCTTLNGYNTYSSFILSQHTALKRPTVSGSMAAVPQGLSSTIAAK